MPTSASLLSLGSIADPLTPDRELAPTTVLLCDRDAPACVGSSPIALNAAPAGALEPIAVSIREAAALSRISRSVIYQEIAANRLRSFCVGARRLILVEDLRAWLHCYRNADGGEPARPSPVARHRDPRGARQ